MFDTALPEIGQVIVDFLDAYLAGDTNTTARLSADADHPGVVALRRG